MVLSQDTRSVADIDRDGVGAGGSLRGYLTNYRDISEAKKQIFKKMQDQQSENNSPNRKIEKKSKDKDATPK